MSVNQVQNLRSRKKTEHDAYVVVLLWVRRGIYLCVCVFLHSNTQCRVLLTLLRSGQVIRLTVWSMHARKHGHVRREPHSQAAHSFAACLSYLCCSRYPTTHPRTRTLRYMHDFKYGYKMHPCHVDRIMHNDLTTQTAVWNVIMTCRLLLEYILSAALACSRRDRNIPETSS